MNLTLTIIILAMGFLLAVVSHLVLRQKHEQSVTKILLYGSGCALFGLIVQCVVHGNCIDVLLLRETYGFGRAYVAGLSVIASVPFTLLLRHIKIRNR